MPECCLRDYTLDEDLFNHIKPIDSRYQDIHRTVQLTHEFEQIVLGCNRVQLSSWYEAGWVLLKFVYISTINQSSAEFGSAKVP